MAASGSTQMAGVVDDDSDDDDARPKQNGENTKSWGGLLGQDIDTTCAYQTYKMVKIKDYKVGIMYWSFVTTIVMYMVIVVFFMDSKHMERDPGVGTVLTMTSNFKAFSSNGNRAFDRADLRHPVVDPAGIFIMTRRVLLPGQTPGSCVDYDSPLNCNHQDCTGDCEGDQCKVSGWCPSLGEHNVESPPEGAIIDVINGLENTVISLASGIAFPSLSDRFWVAGTTPHQPNMFKNVTLGKLLSMAKPPVVFQEVAQYGAVVGVSFYWDCAVTAVSCEPLVVIERIDSGVGFWQKKAMHKRVGGVDVRDASIMYGVRLLVDSSGLGRMAKGTLTIIQLGSGMSLLKIAVFLTDLVILHCKGKQVQRDAYARCKIQETKDFNDMQDQIDKVIEEKSGIRSANAKTGADDLASKPVEDVGLGRSGAKMRVQLGLGAGGQGGMASSILRGRGNVS